MAELELVEMAEAFWEAAGVERTEFEFGVVCALPLNLERLPNLTLATTRQWLRRHEWGRVGLPGVADRPLRACLVALGGQQNFVLLDANDEADEQLFSLAHQVAHFFLDYQRPHERAERRLSRSSLEVLEGLRPTTVEERTQAVLAGVSLRPYHHFMERDATGSILSSVVLAVRKCCIIRCLLPARPLKKPNAPLGWPTI